MYKISRVFNGESWEESPDGIFPEDRITTIEPDRDNNIWIGTAHNGVFILIQ
jgi:ligand-binding sensor domain-containing protein